MDTREKALRKGYAATEGIEERLSEILIAAMIPPKIMGYTFLKTAIKLTMVFPELHGSVTKSLYPAVAVYHHTTAGQVDKAIRHAITIMSLSGGLGVINELFGFEVYGESDKPSNSELIAILSEKMTFELKL